MTENGIELRSPAGSHDLPRLVPFRGLPRQPLQDGRGTVREIHVETAPGLDLRWQLQLVELKGPRATLLAPAGTHQRIVGLSGPQVSVGDAVDRVAALGRDRALSVRSPTIVFQRPRLRVAGASVVVVLTAAASGPPPRLSFRTLDDPTDLVGISLVLLLQGELRVDGVEAARQSALLLDPRTTSHVTASAARVLTLAEESAAAD
ncbi:hypothetical protein LQ938_12555 [Microbacterium sp. cx-55]|uniref:hypothetical protein n=1 Tax=unclassified Microbacterium TaxID=2609290 RepID=UPI001CC0B018|nr:MULTISPECIES: hypothetical protein [unclassified Microbacterium]MBZ4487901.1 hypothetical protein [Microbacterium sp. cx-55]MCC4909066.1 hypothetical protein [Microbacterium sp. cx-59]UGB34688.1 hypothetical protein LQ938_12555 [Microbacterium sp. cx-55]